MRRSRRNWSSSAIAFSFSSAPAIELYQRSVKGKQPAWIAAYLDAGKPADLIEFSRQKQFRDDVPLVIRPDLILTETGYTIAEIDSVPGGIGLTGWLNQTYAALGRDVIGGVRRNAGWLSGVCCRKAATS